MRLITPFLACLVMGCAVQLRPPIYSQQREVGQYRYVVIEDTASVTSIIASNGNTTTRDVNPAQLIEGILLKKGLSKVSAPSAQTIGRLLIVRWGISGKRDVAGGLGYAQEVTVSLLDADSLMPVFTCSAEGVGATEADDIREAITNCMSGLR